MLVLGETREMLVGLCREISRFSRDLVGRAVVLDGGALGSEGLGPATLSTRQVVREGPGRVPLGAGRHAVSASSSLEGNTLTPLRRHGLPPHPPAGARPPAVCIPQPGHLLPRAVVVPPLSQLIGSLEPCSRRRDDSIGYRCSYFQTFLSVFPLVAIF